MLGSGIAFLDATVVNVALPTIADDLGGGLAGLQWTVDAYLLTLSALLLLGGALGDRFGRRRVFVIGLVAFAAASLLCGVAPNIGTLIAARALQGVGGALLVPGSLALISAQLRRDDRGARDRRVVGPRRRVDGDRAVPRRLARSTRCRGGSSSSSTSRWPRSRSWITLRHVPESRDPRPTGHPDSPARRAVTVGLAGVVVRAHRGPGGGLAPGIVRAGVVGGRSRSWRSSLIERAQARTHACR